jgi:hypothetical protein
MGMRTSYCRAVNSLAASTTPFELVEPPLDRSTGVSSAGPFAAWALVDVEIETISVCRLAVAGETRPIDQNCGNETMIFVGTEVFVDDARPNAQAAYPGYSN